MKVAEVVLLRMCVDVQGGLQRPMVDRMPLFVDASAPRSGTGDVLDRSLPGAVVGDRIRGRVFGSKPQLSWRGAER